MYKQLRQDFDLCGYSLERYWEKCSTQIYRALYSMSRHVGAHPDGHQYDDHRSKMLLL